MLRVDATLNQQERRTTFSFVAHPLYYAIHWKMIPLQKVAWTTTVSDHQSDIIEKDRESKRVKTFVVCCTYVVSTLLEANDCTVNKGSRDTLSTPNLDRYSPAENLPSSPMQHKCKPKPSSITTPYAWPTSALVFFSVLFRKAA